MCLLVQGAMASATAPEPAHTALAEPGVLTPIDCR